MIDVPGFTPSTPADRHLIHPTSEVSIEHLCDGDGGASLASAGRDPVPEFARITARMRDGLRAHYAVPRP